jgi:23S rRNA pseudouridine1911/1915/1917 synthase
MAETSWEVAERFETATLIIIDLKTGRTHQIRVHCAAIRHPVAGDLVYGGRSNLSAKPKGEESVSGGLRSAKRQMLHAWRIRFNHPVTKKTMEFEAPVPDDMAELIEGLRNERGRGTEKQGSKAHRHKGTK